MDQVRHPCRPTRGSHERVELMTVHHRVDPFRSGQPSARLERLEVVGARERALVLRLDEDFLPEVRHLPVAVLLVELDEIGERSVLRRVTQPGEVVVDTRLELVEHDVELRFTELTPSVEVGGIDEVNRDYNAPRMSLRRAITGSLLTLAVVSVSGAEDVDFAKDVRPIFAEHCAQCHGPDEGNRMADLHLDVPETFRADSIVVPGEPELSELYRRITAEDELVRMPPALHAGPLAPRDIGVIRRWIEQGAEWQPHWAYAPFRDVEPPSVTDDARVLNSIDRFVLARLEREGIAASPPADRRTLIRRLSLDLIGMGPTPDEVDAFVSDEREDAYERIVDRLLASPHYAERWARHWLDLARYADSAVFVRFLHKKRQLALPCYGYLFKKLLLFFCFP